MLDTEQSAYLTKLRLEWLEELSDYSTGAEVTEGDCEQV